MRNLIEGRSIAKFERCYRRLIDRRVRKALWRFIRWESPIGTVEVWLALLKVDGWRGTKDTGDSRSLYKFGCWSPYVVEVWMEFSSCRSPKGGRLL